MGKYKNPVPSINDERVSAKFSIVFKFEETMILDEAAEGINMLLCENGGRIPKEWVRMGEPIFIRHDD
ncbi:MAG: hypothetical protein GX289_06435 [Tissierellia bacterium]|jgi:hypothetical protein|nr:hypothetical protein [Tissierellia bacterium]HAS90907.1 hypothetical protein [Clostridiales bacterium]